MLSSLTKQRFVYFILATILLGGFGVRFYKIDSPVADWHSWRQADTASVSLTFAEEGIDLLYPRYHDVSSIQSGYSNPEGYRFVEVPIFNAFHAVFFNIVPAVPFDVWGRLVSVFSALVTAVFLFALGKRIGGNAVGLLAAFFYSFLPFNIYFTRVILPDPMSVSFAVAAVFFFAKYTDRSKLYYLFSFAVAFAIAMLVKPHAIFFGLPVAYLAIKKYGLIGVFKDKWLFVAIDIILIPFFLWRVWIYREGLMRGIPFWEWAFNGTGIRFRPAFWRWIFVERLGTLILGVWGVVPFALGLMSARKNNWLPQAFFVGAVLYAIVFASANVMHDYYQIFIIPAVSLSLAVGTHALWVSRESNRVAAKLVLLFCLSMMFGVGVYSVKDNYRINDPAMVRAGAEIDTLIPKDARIIASYGGDTTFLYQTKRWGWPVITTSIEKLIEEGADYYVSVDFTHQDTINFSKDFETLHKTDSFIIVDLHKEKVSQ